MPRWADLVVPLISIGGALLGVGLGSWWQGRSSLRMLREQSQDTWAARKHQVRHEQMMRMFDDKRAAYVRLFGAVDQLASAALRVDSEMPPDFVATFELPQLGMKAEISPEDRATGAASEVDEVLAIIELLAPNQVYQAAVAYATTTMTNGPRFSPGNSNFIDFVRYDLGLDANPPPDWRLDLAEDEREAAKLR